MAISGLSILNLKTKTFQTMLISATIVVLGIFIRFLWKKTYIVVSKRSLLFLHILVMFLLVIGFKLNFAEPNSEQTFMSKLTQVGSLYVCLVASAIFWMYGKKEHWYDKYQLIPSIILFLAGIILMGINYNFFLNFFLENDLVRILAVAALTGTTLSIMLLLHSSMNEQT